jgi:hypothetical protein
MVRGRVASDGSYVYVDPDRLAAFVRDGGGPIVADLSRRGTNVQGGARRQVGKVTRRLERSIVKRPGVDNRGPFLLVVSEGVEYGYWHHEGTSPHMIYPRTARVLSWTSGDRRLFATSVRHPGTRPNRFLTDNLPLARR